MTSWPVTATAPIKGCVFKFECPKTWGLLQKTNVDTVRYCESCQRNVYLSVGAAELDTNVLKGRCIAVPIEKPNTSRRKYAVSVGDCTLGFPMRNSDYLGSDYEND